MMNLSFIFAAYEKDIVCLYFINVLKLHAKKQTITIQYANIIMMSKHYFNIMGGFFFCCFFIYFFTENAIGL